MTEQELIRGCLEGDERSYEELFNRYEARALRVAYALLGDRLEAEDASQEGFVQAFRTLHRQEPGSSFGPWLYRAVVWAARKRGRKFRRWRDALASFADRSDEVVGASHVDELEARSTVIEALRDLSLEHRAVIVLRYYLDLPEAEVAAILGCRVGTVKSRKARALRHLARSPWLAWRVARLEGSSNA